MAAVEPHGEIGAVGGGVAQRVKLSRVEALDALAERGVVLRPGLGRVGAVGAGGGEYRVPQPLQRVLLAQAGEHLLRPGGSGDARDAPDVAPLIHAVIERAAVAEVGAGHRREARRIHTRHAVGVAAVQLEDHRAALRRAVAPQCLPRGHLLKRRRGGVEVVHAADRVIRPLQIHRGGACLPGLLHHHADKVRRVHGRVD